MCLCSPLGVCINNVLFLSLRLPHLRYATRSGVTAGAPSYSRLRRCIRVRRTKVFQPPPPCCRGISRHTSIRRLSTAHLLLLLQLRAASRAAHGTLLTSAKKKRTSGLSGKRSRASSMTCKHLDSDVGDGCGGVKTIDNKGFRRVNSAAYAVMVMFGAQRNCRITPVPKVYPSPLSP